MTLAEIIKNKIQVNGPMSFHDFMEMALYSPQYGYYNSSEERIGEAGDFLTSPCYTSLFGKMIARQIGEMWQLLDRQPFTILECGAGNGMLCRDVLHYLKENRELYNKLNYSIIEKSDTMRQREKEIIEDTITWYDDVQDVPPFNGCVLSNELIDNFSVHQVIMLDELMEVFVGYDNGFIEILKPAPAFLQSYFDQLGVVLPKGFRTEVNLEAVEWIRSIASILQKGYVLTIDYGYPSSGMYQDNRCEGTLVCYHKHRVNYCPYINIGSQDITTHVNFSALHYWGQKSGLELSGYTNQGYFLRGLGLGMEKETANIQQGAAKFIYAFLHDMGQKLKVLIQQKGMPPSLLSGLRFCQRYI